MEFGWGGGGPLSPTAGGAGTDLNLLGDNLLIDLDDKTLQVKHAHQNQAPAPAALRHAPGSGGRRVAAASCQGVGSLVVKTNDLRLPMHCA
jgi:hypothetical protein